MYINLHIEAAGAYINFPLNIPEVSRGNRAVKSSTVHKLRGNSTQQCFLLGVRRNARKKQEGLFVVEHVPESYEKLITKPKQTLVSIPTNETATIMRPHFWKTSPTTKLSGSSSPCSTCTSSDEGMEDRERECAVTCFRMPKF